MLHLMLEKGKGRRRDIISVTLTNFPTHSLNSPAYHKQAHTHQTKNKNKKKYKKPLAKIESSPSTGEQLKSRVEVTKGPDPNPITNPSSHRSSGRTPFFPLSLSLPFCQTGKEKHAPHPCRYACRQHF